MNQLLFLAVIAAVVILGTIAKPAAAAAPAPALLPEPYPGYYNEIEKCKNIVGEGCAKMIYWDDVVATKGGFGINEACCRQVVAAGIRCHVTLSSSTLEIFLQMNGPIVDREKVVDNSFETWNVCIGEVSKMDRLRAEWKRLPPPPSIVL